MSAMSGDPRALGYTLVAGEQALVQILSVPNAIGVCKVRYQDQEFSRHHTQLRPHTQAAKDLLDSGVRFVQRDARAAVDPTKAEPRIAGWDMSLVEMLRLMILDEVTESQWLIRRARTRQERGALVATNERWHARLRWVNEWLKGHRRKLIACKAGITDEQRRDPEALLAALQEVAFRLRRRLREAGLEGCTEEEVALQDSVAYYLAHYATAPQPSHGTKEAG